MSHVDFKRKGLSWLVWCEKDWRDVYILAEVAICDHCDGDISHRFKAAA